MQAVNNTYLALLESVAYQTMPLEERVKAMELLLNDLAENGTVEFPYSLINSIRFDGNVMYTFKYANGVDGGVRLISFDSRLNSPNVSVTTPPNNNTTIQSNNCATTQPNNGGIFPPNGNNGIKPVADNFGDTFTNNSNNFYITLKRSESRIRTTEQNPIIYFYAEVHSGVRQLTLMNVDNNQIIGDMFDDGRYDISGDDLPEDGIYTYRGAVDNSKEATLSFFAFCAFSGISSNIVTIQIYTPSDELSLAERRAVNNAIANLLESNEYKALSFDRKVEAVSDLLSELENNGTVEFPYSLINSIVLSGVPTNRMFSFNYRSGLSGSVQIRRCMCLVCAECRPATHNCENKCVCSECVCDCTNKNCHDCGTCEICNLPHVCENKCVCSECVCDCTNKNCHDCGTCEICTPSHVCGNKCICPECVCDCTNKNCHDCGTCEICTLLIERPAIEISFLNGEAKIWAEAGVIPRDAVFEVVCRMPPPEDIVEKVKEKYGSDATIIGCYEITLAGTDGALIKMLDGEITIAIRLPTEFYNGSGVRISQIDENGTLIELESWVENGYIFFKTSWL